MSVKPKLSHSHVSELVGRLYGMSTSQIHPLPSYYDQNFYVLVNDGRAYVMKIMNSLDSQNLTLLELQTHAMAFLHQRGIPAQTALPTLTGQMMSLEDIDCGSGCQKYLVRLLTYLPGTTIAKVPCSPQILYQAGKMAATMDKALLEMEHPNLWALQREDFIWNPRNLPLLEPYLHVMDGDPVQQVVKEVIETFKRQVLPNLGSFRKCIIHGDFSDLNVLIEPSGPAGYKISGILDFGHMSNGYYVFELAITIMYMMIESHDPIQVGGPVLAGWESVIPLNEAERNALYLLVLGRFCQSLVMGRYNATLQPENKEYLMTTAKNGSRHLMHLWELGKEEVEMRWIQGARMFSDMR
ncbi:hydroxylysine kinase-like [Megalops cyprinoides]|uniref:hydroxylysine kinase-like n=1 Tax=Megalops cyprinoides TaxID=118141 RepID=UPI00186471F6|nr:hydroxylysine kinase-like [Megalops cyprinoides]